jgi:hypothetical protein
MPALKVLKSWPLAMALTALLPSFALAENYALVDRDLKTYDETVAAKEDLFNKVPVNIHDKEWVKLKLTHMVDVDQYMRNFANITFEHHYGDDETKYFWRQFQPRWTRVDSQDTEDLKSLLKIYNWFTIPAFGVQADREAWLLVQHADLDLPFQRRVLSILEKLYPSGETSPSNYAYLFDRIAASWNNPNQRTLQRYGTQGICTGPGTWAPLPVEDPPNLDNRRKQVGLGTEAEYIKMFKDLCH